VGRGADPVEKLYTIDSDTEVLHVLDGRLRLVLPDRSIELGPGDTYTFRGREPQRLEMVDPSAPVEAIMALAPAPRGWSRTPGRSLPAADTGTTPT